MGEEIRSVQDTLYESDKIKITYLHSPKLGERDRVISYEDHELWMRGKDEEWWRYIIPRGVLRELAGNVEDGSLERMMRSLDLIDPEIMLSASRKLIFRSDIGKAILAAYKKERADREELGAQQQLW